MTSGADSLKPLTSMFNRRRFNHKPHVFLVDGIWRCSLGAGRWQGLGYTPLDAWKDWDNREKGKAA